MHSGHMNALSSSSPKHRRNEFAYSNAEAAAASANGGGEGFSGLFVAAMGALGLLTGGAGVSAWNHTVAMGELEANTTNKRITEAANRANLPLSVGSSVNVDQAQVDANTAHIDALNAQVAQLTKALGRYALWNPPEEGGAQQLLGPAPAANTGSGGAQSV